MKKRALAVLMAAAMTVSMAGTAVYASDFSGEDPQLEKKTITFEPQLIVRESTRQI